MNIEIGTTMATFPQGGDRMWQQQTICCFFEVIITKTETYNMKNKKNIKITLFQKNITKTLFAFDLLLFVRVVGG